MTAELAKHFQSIAADRTPLWIDAWGYGEKLLNKGQPAPWDDVAGLVSLANKLQDLVGSDVLTVEVLPFYDYWLARHPALLQAMAEKRRLGYPLRTLLADPEARSQLHQIVEALGDSHAEVPLVLALPSPRQWMGRACCQARGIESVEVSWDDAESASMYLADYLRSFADCRLGGVLVRDLPGEGPADASELARYQPLINVAQHYRWCVVLDGGAVTAIDGCDGNHVLTLGGAIDGLTGLRITDFDNPGDLPTLAGGKHYCHVQVPEGAIPERVLECLENLRRSAS